MHNEPNNSGHVRYYLCLFIAGLVTATVIGAGLVNPPLTPPGGGNSSVLSLGQSNITYTMIQTYAPTNGGVTAVQAGAQIQSSNTTFVNPNILTISNSYVNNNAGKETNIFSVTPTINNPTFGGSIGNFTGGAATLSTVTASVKITSPTNGLPMRLQTSTDAEYYRFDYGPGYGGYTFGNPLLGNNGLTLTMETVAGTTNPEIAISDRGPVYFPGSMVGQTNVNYSDVAGNPVTNAITSQGDFALFGNFHWPYFASASGSSNLLTINNKGDVVSNDFNATMNGIHVQATNVSGLLTGTNLGPNGYVATDANTNLYNTQQGYSWTNLNVFDAPTNAFSGTVFLLGTNFSVTTASDVHFISIGNIPPFGVDRYGQITIVASGNINITNPPVAAGWRSSDMQISRILTNGDSATIALDVQVGHHTNFFYVPCH